MSVEFPAVELRWFRTVTTHGGLGDLVETRGVRERGGGKDGNREEKKGNKAYVD